MLILTIVNIVDIDAVPGQGNKKGQLKPKIHACCPIYCDTATQLIYITGLQYPGFMLFFHGYAFQWLYKPSIRKYSTIITFKTGIQIKAKTPISDNL